jgi:tetratricopeptide (TPR) repeat protein
MTDGLDRDERRRLEEERDFLLQSLDDLELEHGSGGIDDESYAELHDDYTARAAAAVRALRDGVDARPEPPRSKRTTRRRVVIVAGIVVFALVVGALLSSTLGVRLPGQTSSGNSGADTETAASKKVAAEITRLQQAVNAKPDDYDLRLQLAEAYANNNDLPTAIKQWDAAIKIDAKRPEAQASLGRALYLVSEQIPDKPAQQQAIAESIAAFDTAISNAPEYTDSYFFRAVVRAGIAQYAGSQADLQTYILKTPDGQWAAQARDLLARVTTALESPSTTVPPTTTQPKK